MRCTLTAVTGLRAPVRALTGSTNWWWRYRVLIPDSTQTLTTEAT